MSFIIHRKQDNVGVVSAIQLLKDTTVKGIFIEDRSEFELQLQADIALGRLIALTDIKLGDTVLKGGFPIGIAHEEIKKGGLVNQPALKPVISVG